MLYLGGVVKLGASGPPLAVLFVIVPWVAVMAAGYAFGPVMQSSPERRRAVCIRLGIAMTLYLISASWQPGPLHAASTLYLLPS